MTAITSGEAFILASDQHQFDIYSSGGSGTFALLFAADGTNFRTVDVTSQYTGTGSGGFILKAGEDETGTAKWKCTLGGDAVAKRFRVRDN